MKKQPVQPIFSRNVDIDKIAFLSWRFDEGDIRSVLNLAEGFMMSGIELAEYCLVDNAHKKADILIFPILNNTNHSIELYLKGLIWIFNTILDNNLKIEKGHNIKQLYEAV
jgi:hypothetical protein